MKVVSGGFLLVAVLVVMCAALPRVVAATAIFAGGGAEDERRGDVTVVIRVNPPAETPNDATLYISGSAAGLGPWDPAARALQRPESKGGPWQVSLTLPAGEVLEYKITRGSWATVEKGARGEEIGNRTLTAAEGLVVTIDVLNWSDGTTGGGRVSSLTGNIVRVPTFRSEILNNERSLIIYLPPMYTREPERRFPVLYMHDGQNIFDRATSTLDIEWEADEAAERLIGEGAVEPLIIVGIETKANRAAELGTTPDPESPEGGADAALYARFLVEEVKPFIDRTYRTLPGRDHTGVGGSSLGGLMSLYLMERNPEVFSRAAVVSPALIWNDEALTRRWVARADRLPLRHARLWIDVGTAEIVRSTAATAYVDAVRRLVDVLPQAGLTEGRDYRFVVEDGAVHNEAAWARRFPDMLRFLYPAKPQSETE